MYVDGCKHDANTFMKLGVNNKHDADTCLKMGVNMIETQVYRWV